MKKSITVIFEIEREISDEKEISITPELLKEKTPKEFEKCLLKNGRCYIADDDGMYNFYSINHN